MSKAIAMLSLLIVVALAFQETLAAGETAPHPLLDQDRATLAKSLDAEIDETTRVIEQSPDGLQEYSRRGDALFFRGRFGAAVEDYDKTVELKPGLADSHWRRGIALFYAGSFEKAAGQFERYHTYDNVDRENGIWRYFSQTKAYGKERAQQDLLKYKKDDREPFPSVYRLFQGKISPREIIDEIESAQIGADEKEKRRFYAHLYIGLNFALGENSEAALLHLHAAVANRWPREAGYGPRYMWHVGRIHYELLAEAP